MDGVIEKAVSRGRSRRGARKYYFEVRDQLLETRRRKSQRRCLAGGIDQMFSDDLLLYPGLRVRDHHVLSLDDAMAFSIGSGGKCAAMNSCPAIFPCLCLLYPPAASRGIFRTASAGAASASRMFPSLSSRRIPQFLPTLPPLLSAYTIPRSRERDAVVA